MQSVVEMTKAIAQKRMSPDEAIQLSAKAIDKSEPKIQAFAALADYDRLTKQASKARGPLAGIAVGIKDVIDTFDLPTEYGSPIYAGNRPKGDAAIATMFRRAGASVIGKTTTTEFAFFNPAKTRNPHNTAHTPGGSSSGSAAAVAAGMIPAAVGTQTGGSVIRPAAFCGVAGYKPSFRLLPTPGLKHFSVSLDTIGLFAASVGDVALLAEGLTGRQLAAKPIETHGTTIGIYRTIVWSSASPEMRAAVEEAGHIAAALGFKVIDITEPPALSAARIVHGIIQDYEGAQALGYEFDNHREKLSAKLIETLEAGRAIPPAAYDAARRTAKRAREHMRSVFETVDVLLTPSAPGAAPAGLGTTGDPIFNKLWTLMGTPCVNIPGFSDSQGMPLGIQTVSRFGSDQELLSVAAMLQDAFPQQA